MNVISQNASSWLNSHGLFAVIDGLGLALNVLNALVVNIIDFVDFVGAVRVVVVLVGYNSQCVNMITINNYINSLVILGVVVLVDDHSLQVIILGLNDLLLSWQLALLLLIIISWNWWRSVARVIDWWQLWQLVFAIVSVG